MNRIINAIIKLRTLKNIQNFTNQFGLTLEK